MIFSRRQYLYHTMNIKPFHFFLLVLPFVVVVAKICCQSKKRKISRHIFYCHLQKDSTADYTLIISTIISQIECPAAVKLAYSFAR